MRYRYQSRDQVYEVELERHGSGFRARVDGVPFELEVLDSRPGALSLRFEARPRTLFWAIDGEKRWVSLDGCTYLLEKPTPQAARRSANASQEASVRSPMPAQVRTVAVYEGQEVQKGQTLLLLEAMKMEIRIQSPRQGRVNRLWVAEGQPVDRDQALVEIGDASPEAEGTAN